MESEDMSELGERLKNYYLYEIMEMIITIGICYGQVRMIKKMLSGQSVVWKITDSLALNLNKSAIMLWLVGIFEGSSDSYLPHLLFLWERLNLKSSCKFHYLFRLTHPLFLLRQVLLIFTTFPLKILLFLLWTQEQVLWQLRVRFPKLFSLLWSHEFEQFEGNVGLGGKLIIRIAPKFPVFFVNEILLFHPAHFEEMVESFWS